MLFFRKPKTESTSTSHKCICSLNSDTLSAHTPSYIEAMVSNTKTLKACLDPQSLPAWDFEPGVGHALNDLYTN